ncbi:hypothetical protein HYW99_02235 [Candidatus Woesearchaeota archaeon]|nr:hypothetical protein [Candidatus Woesearchaeota archaeon]
MESTDLLKERSINKVVILGAGASADAGAPTLNQFWNKVQELIEHNKFTTEEIKQIKNIFEKRKVLLPDSNIEEFFSYVDFQIQFEVLISSSKIDRMIHNRIINKNDPCRIPVPEIRHVRKEKKDFIELKKKITWVITKTLDESLNIPHEEIEKCYVKLIDKFDVTISFNWDILYERSYRKSKGISIPIKNLGFGNEIYKPALLKLHGSIDWGDCNQCCKQGFPHMSDIKEHIVYEGKICPNCSKNKLNPTLIMPSLRKFEEISTIKTPPYKNIWSCAMHALSDAQEIYFFGYSLSDNDTYSKIFLRSGILKNINPELKLYVIDKCCCEDFKNRYRKAFESKAKPIFIEQTFKEFLSRQ